MARAAVLKAPGSRSPNWPRNSSLATVPLLIIWPMATRAPEVSAADRPSAALALVTAPKMSRVLSPSSAVPWAEAWSWANALAADRVSTPICSPMRPT